MGFKGGLRGLGIQGLGFREWHSVGFRALGLGIKVLGLG